MEPVEQTGLEPDRKDRVADSEALETLLEKVYRGGGHDFREYKRGTVMRRLERRLYATRTRTYLEYMQFLDSHAEEYQRLADDLTLKVSAFYRSRYTFAQLARLVLPELMLSKGDRSEGLRFWSAACARGEAPYSMAILLAEFLGLRLRDFKVAIYATDISRQALHEARLGLYSAKEIESLSPAILENYFTRQGTGYGVNSNIRQTVSFSYLDLVSTKAPPFTNLDGIFCCNILIYLQKQLQERCLACCMTHWLPRATWFWGRLRRRQIVCGRNWSVLTPRQRYKRYIRRMGDLVFNGPGS